MTHCPYCKTRLPAHPLHNRDGLAFCTPRCRTNYGQIIRRTIAARVAVLEKREAMWRTHNLIRSSRAAIGASVMAMDGAAIDEAKTMIIADGETGRARPVPDSGPRPYQMRPLLPLCP